jgi:hypothetical protein
LFTNSVSQGVTTVAGTSVAVPGRIGRTGGTNSIDNVLSGSIALTTLGGGVEERIERTVLIGDALTIAESVAGIADTSALTAAILGV